MSKCVHMLTARLTAALLVVCATAYATSDAIQSRLQEIAVTVLDDTRTQIIVKRDEVKLQSNPYVPSNVERDFATTSAKSLSIVVLHSRKLDKDQESELRNAILETVKSEGYTLTEIKLTRISIPGGEGSSSNQASQRAREELLQATNMLQQVQTEMRKLERELDDKAKETAALKAEIAEKSQDKQNNNAMDQAENWFKALKNNKSSVAIVFSIIIGALLLVVVALTLSLRKMSKSFESGLMSIAKSFDSSKAREARIALDGGLPNGGGTQVNIDNTEKGNGAEVIQTEMINIVEQIKKSLHGITSTDALNTIVSYVKDTLSNDKTLNDAVGALELLGREGAAIVFNKLEPSEQEKIYANIRNVNWGGSKMRCLIRTAEALKTRLLEVELPRPDTAVNAELARKLGTLTEEQVQGLLARLSPESIARLSAYMRPDQFAGAIASLAESPERAESVSSAIENLTSASGNSSFDGDIATNIESVLGGTSVRETWASKYVSEVANTLSEDVVDGLVTRLQQHQSPLAPVIRHNVVSSKQFFDFPPEVQRDIADTIPAKTLAAWSLGLDSAQNQSLLNILDEFQRDVLAEELRRLQSNPTAAEQASKEARSQLAKIVRSRLNKTNNKRNNAA